MVSQGRIGWIIGAKPIERRALLEEAAGISGLHARRHEAELRLRAAEANLTRLDDIVRTQEEQLEALKKQARQAGRYRRLSDHIRRAEAMVLHLRWLRANAELEAAVERLHAVEGQVGELTMSALAAERGREQAANVLPGLRQSEAAASAELQRLTLARHHPHVHRLLPHRRGRLQVWPRHFIQLGIVRPPHQVSAADSGALAQRAAPT